MEYNDKIIPVKITVKEFNTKERGTRIYSVEAIDVVLDAKKRMLVDRRLPNLIKSSNVPSPARHPHIYNIVHIFDSVNEYLQKKSVSQRVHKAMYGEELRTQKSLTWSGYKLQDKYKFAGFNISIENKKGSTRSGKDKATAPEKAKPALIINRSLMRKVWEIYNPKKAEEAAKVDENIKEDNNQIGGSGNGEGKDNTGTGSGELSADSPAVRAGGSEGASGINVPSPGQADNKGESGGASVQSGGGSGGDIRGS